MAKYTRIQVATVMQETGLVPLFYNGDIELSKKIVKACYDGGARLLEFTARGDFAFEIFSDLIKYILFCELVLLIDVLLKVFPVKGIKFRIK